MKISLKSTALGLAAFGALAIAAPAWAGCGGAELSKSPAKFEQGKGDGSLLIRVANQNGQGNQGTGPAIVGLWAITLTGSDGKQVDFGYSEWHADGTEIMNSGGHPASAGNFCLGVWAQTGGNTYHLNHIALAYDPGNPFTNPPPAGEAPGGLVAKISLTEDVSLAPGGNRFSGHFNQVGYSAVAPFGPIAGFAASGSIVGVRVTPY